MEHVWTALIAAFAALAGSAVTGLLSIRTARDQAHREQEAERRRWRRDIRHAAYREVTDTYAHLSPLLSAVADEAYRDGYPSDERMRGLFGDLESFYTSCSRLALVGPRPVAEAGEALRAHMLGVHRALDPYARREVGDRPTSIDVSGELREVRASYYDFMRTARHALMSSRPDADGGG